MAANSVAKIVARHFPNAIAHRSQELFLKVLKKG